MTDQTRNFVMRAFQQYVELFYLIDTTREQHVYKTEAGSLLNLGFTTVSHEDSGLKLVGFDLILSVINVLSQITDRVQDDMDEEEDEF